MSHLLAVIIDMCHYFVAVVLHCVAAVFWMHVSKGSHYLLFYSIV